MLKKSVSLLCPGTSISRQLVEDLQKKADPKVAVSQACRILDISRSGYYARLAAHKRRLAEPAVCAQSVHLKAAFAGSHRAYGSRRRRAAIAERGLAMGRHTVRTLMRPQWSAACLAAPSLSIQQTASMALAVLPSVLNRQFEQAMANQVWVADITYSRTRSGWLYLAAVLDLHSRKIVGWADGHCSKKSIAWADRAFRPVRAVRQR